MADHAVYVYAVGDASLAGSDAVSTVRGVDGSPVRVITHGGLTAAVGSVDLARFNEEALRANLEDMGWLEDTARAHNTVVATLAGTHPIAPMRMATVYLDDDRVRGLLGEHASGLSAALDRIRGRCEWGVKAFVPRNPEKVQQPVSSGPGTNYLMRRRAERDQATRSREESLAAAEAVHRRIAACAVASRRYPPQDPRLSGHTDVMVLNAAYLVDEAGTAVLEQHVGSADAASLRLELTGPWAPYSFATLEQL